MARVYITTPIYYVNDRPHVGHAYTTIAADVLARYHRLRGDEVAFLTGTDENSQKTVDAASRSKEEIRAYTDRLADLWRVTWKELGITNTDFIRTTEDRHRKVVSEIWKRILEKGDIYKGKYDGLYCNGHEAFIKESELIGGLCPDHQTRPERIVEENYFFKLSKYQKLLLDFYGSNPHFVTPEARFNEVRSFVRSGLEDISVSRPGKGWGIPVPDDPTHAIYVWFDALINYVSAVGIKAWNDHPADVHTIGKDIVRFHAIIWPAMLISAGLALPKQVATNGFFTIDGVKISKSLGNAIDPIDLKQKYGVDALRYFLLREIPYGGDGDFSEEKLKERYNGDLANGLGNFTARVLTLGEKLSGADLKTVDREIEAKISEAKRDVQDKLSEFKFHEALASVWDLIATGDAYVNKKKPWETSDSTTIFTLIVLLDNVGGLLLPFLPETSGKITKSIHWVSPSELKIKKSEPLFPRIV
ncbi:methionine--tRNA ligase [Candidatus Parcubacteria bacterium]|nr:MAG: methionine--tRNA ligase [Candidatus Parcubacteria bacterium]